MKEDKVIRVAQVIGKWVGGGVEALVLNYYRNIDRTKIQFDFICDSDSKNIPVEEIESLGGRIIIVPPYQKVFEYQKVLIDLFKKNKYSIVHSHINTLSVFPLRAAKKAGVPIRIAHSHSTSNKKEWKKNLLKTILKRFSKTHSNVYYACSMDAGKYQFGEKTFNAGSVEIIKNAIDIDRFSYDETKRLNVRKELNIGKDDFVMGHVSRFTNEKNIPFVINIFNDILKNNKSAKLLLIGDGPKTPEIITMVNSLKINDQVIFMGRQEKVDKFYQAMDAFLLPSLYEGLGMVLVEAQCSGVNCFASSNVPDEVKLTENFMFLDLSLSSKKWANKIKEQNNKIYDRTISANMLQNEGYDIVLAAKELERKYFKLLEEQK